jgi:hypothetical protein
MTEELCAGPELAGAAVWQIIGILCTFYEVFCVGHSRGPVESRSVHLIDQVGGCCVAATLAAVNLSQEL